MASRRRIGVESSETRAQLLDTAERIMQEEGYPAVTTRRIASRMGVSNQLVHYYFRTMEDLFIALMRRGSERNLGALRQAFASEDPLRALWTIYGDPNFTRLAIEYMALTNHRKDIAAEASRHTKRMRELEAEALSRVLAEHGIDQGTYPAAGVAVLLSAIPRVMAMEAALGISEGHREATALVREFFRKNRMDMSATAPRRRKGHRTPRR